MKNVKYQPKQPSGNHPAYWIKNSCWAIFALICLTGCSSLMSSATVQMADNLSRAIMNHNDLETVRQGAPAYLLMIESFLESDPHNPDLLIAASKLYTAYSDVFVQDSSRKKRLTDKGLEYSTRAVCVLSRKPSLTCDFKSPTFDEFQRIIDTMTVTEVPAYFALGTAWAAWIQARQDNMDAIAEISRIEIIMEKILAVNETFQHGSAHVYMGVIHTLLPPALGGKPETGRLHFETALTIFQGNLMVKTLFAKQYARLVFDRNLHDLLLNEVLTADPDVPGYLLNNLVAQEMARELLAGAEDFF